jgi:hypothetical protein
MKQKITIVAALIILSFAALSQTTNKKKFHGTTTVTGIDRLIKLPNGGFTMLSANRLYSVNANGVILWSKDIPSTGGKSFQSWSFVRTADGSYVIAGYFDQRQKPQNVVTLIKADANGNLIWSRQFSDTHVSTATAIIKTRDGGFALTGTARELSLGGDVPHDDAYVMKLDSSANVEWTSVIGSDGITDESYAITQTSDNGYAIAGFSYVSGAPDIFVAKVNSNGNLLWSKFFGDADSDDFASRIIETTDGGLAILARHGSVPSSIDYFLIKLQSSGVLQWAKYYGGSNIDYAGSFIQLTDGSYVMTGISYSFGDGYDIYNIKTNASGDVQLSKATPGWGNVILANGSGFVIGGYDQTRTVDGALVQTDNNLNTCDSRNVTTVTHVSTRNINANFRKKNRAFTVTPLSFTTVNSTVSVSQICGSALPANTIESSVKSLNDFKISIYPNPVKEKMVLQLISNHSSQAQMSILNAQGTLHFSKNISVRDGESREIINTSFLRNGSYFLSIIFKNGDKKFFPFIKE